MVWSALVWYVWIVLGPKAYGMMGQRGKDRRLGVETQASSWRSRGRGSEIFGVVKGVRAGTRDQSRSDKSLYSGLDSILTKPKGPSESTERTRAKGRGHFGCTGIRILEHARWTMAFGMRRTVSAIEWQYRPMRLLHGLLGCVRACVGGIVCVRETECEVRLA
ncbi:uncharacterized protein BKA55DRAFT_124649 [Fusarium redolens]|uniref:Secreted protein n=1 Tax=Fusarium redolens TaxID=48865 RepID=A0A9P9GFH4_FUSRE|nr:uncharacterized protein BKA55DRAFT_124649 [Fusarium redolens]KAH7237590.1 hypothetical protein BKA55DRAFT_124649 [Fusarium redolens]